MGITLLAVMALSGPVIAQQPAAPADNAFALYLAVTTGKTSWQSLTPQQRAEVSLVASMMKKPRYSSRKCDDLADAEQQLQSARDDLRMCLVNADPDDDCDSQKQDEQDAKEQYDSAKSDADDDCE
jgi:hypothetical protein